jgi:hypothetical protein
MRMLLKDALLHLQERDNARNPLTAIGGDSQKYDSSVNRQRNPVSELDEAVMVSLAMQGLSYDKIAVEMNRKFSKTTIVYHVQRYRPSGEPIFKMGRVRELFKRAGLELPEGLNKDFS